MEFRVWDKEKNETVNLNRDDVKFFIDPYGRLCRAIIYDGGATLFTYPLKKYFDYEII